MRTVAKTKPGQNRNPEIPQTILENFLQGERYGESSLGFTLHAFTDGNARGRLEFARAEKLGKHAVDLEGFLPEILEKKDLPPGIDFILRSQASRNGRQVPPDEGPDATPLAITCTLSPLGAAPITPIGSSDVVARIIWSLV